MPKNNDLKPTTFPMEIRFGEKPITDFVNNLKSIKISLVSAPSMEDLRSYLVDFATATWEDNPVHSSETMTNKEKDKIIYMIFNEKILPSALETVRLTFLLDGISYQDVSHILRYRTATFSAECSADKWWSHKTVTVPTSIENSPEFYARYKKIHEDVKQLYTDMIDSKDISLIDARYILTRGMETYYWMSMNLKDAIAFVKQRIDKQIQPESDNVIAYGFWDCLISKYPLLVNLVDIHSPAMFYVKTARTNRCTNLFVPDKDSDIYEWNENDYLYKRTRREVNGTDKELAKTNYPFGEILNQIDGKVAKTKKEIISIYGKTFFEVD